MYPVSLVQQQHTGMPDPKQTDSTCTARKQTERQTVTSSAVHAKRKQSVTNSYEQDSKNPHSYQGAWFTSPGRHR